MIQREWMNNGSMRICFFLLMYILSLSSSFRWFFVEFVQAPINKYIFYIRQIENGWTEDHLGAMQHARYVLVCWLIFFCFFCIRAKRHQYLNLNVHNNNCFCNVPVHGRTRADYPMPNMYVVHIQALILTQLYFCRCC